MSRTNFFQSTPVLIVAVVALLLVVVTTAIYKDNAATRLDSMAKQQANSPVTNPVVTQSESTALQTPENAPETAYSITVKHLTTQQQEQATGDAKRTMTQAEALITQGDQILKAQGVTNLIQIETATQPTGQTSRHNELQARLDALKNVGQ
ncbi:MAG: hypothetical protein JKY93_11715 [Gammaproteobacteria bacterium]|nr:hypothetical protein [Gammaproteobacteria bacterium]